MGYCIELVNPVTKETLLSEQKHEIKGSIYCVGGTRELELNITYNYSSFYYNCIPEWKENGIRTIYGMTTAESIPMLKKAIAALKDDADPDYWKATEGNAKKALYGLLAFAYLRPDGVWEGD